MFNSMLNFVFGGAVDLYDKFFCMCLFIFTADCLFGIFYSLVRGNRK